MLCGTEEEERIELILEQRDYSGSEQAVRKQVLRRERQNRGERTTKFWLDVTLPTTRKEAAVCCVLNH
jgi:hypothetical protein